MQRSWIECQRQSETESAIFTAMFLNRGLVRLSLVGHDVGLRVANVITCSSRSNLHYPCPIPTSISISVTFSRNRRNTRLCIMSVGYSDNIVGRFSLTTIVVANNICVVLRNVRLTRRKEVIIQLIFNIDVKGANKFWVHCCFVYFKHLNWNL